MGGISGWEGIVLLLLVLLVVGPDKLPEIAGQLGGWARTARDLLRDAKTTLKDEFGEDLTDLKSLDPRQYDPRRIVREALMEDTPRPAPKRPPVAPAAPEPPPVAPFDDEAT